MLVTQIWYLVNNTKYWLSNFVYLVLIILMKIKSFKATVNIKVIMI